MQTASSLFSIHNELKSIELLTISEVESSRKTETIRFSGLLEQNFTLTAKVTEIRILTLQLDLRLLSQPGQEFAEIQDPKQNETD